MVRLRIAAFASVALAAALSLAACGARTGLEPDDEGTDATFEPRPDGGLLDASDARDAEGGAGRPDARESGGGAPESGPPEAGRPETGVPESAPPEGGPPETGPPESGVVESGPPESGPPESGPLVDARPPPPCDAACVEAPRPIAPLSTSRLTKHQPTFRWALDVHDDGAVVEICADPGCGTLIMSFTAKGSSAAAPRPLTHGFFFWRLRGTDAGVVGTATSPAWEIFVPARDTDVDTSWGTTLDLNRDGYADVAVGVEADQTQGAAYVYSGGRGGVSFLSTTTYNQPGVDGALVASGGDIDGDGFPELIVGSSEANGNHGQIRVVKGGPELLQGSTTLPAPAGLLQFGASVASAGDVDGDGYGDLLVSAVDAGGRAFEYLYFGSATGLRSMPQVLAAGHTSAEAVATDINGDGYSDVLVTANGAPGSNAGVLDVYMGTATGLSATPTAIAFNGDTRGAPFLLHLAAAGDVNGDGFGDVAVSMRNVPPPLTVNVLLGGAMGLQPKAFFLTDPGASPFFGSQIAGVGDIDADGYGDIVCSYGNARQVYVYRGGPMGPLGSMPSITVVAPANNTGLFGAPVAAMGDVNGDGFDDVGIASAYGTASFVYPGAAAGFGGATPWSVGAIGPMGFGESLASAAMLQRPYGNGRFGKSAMYFGL